MVYFVWPRNDSNLFIGFSCMIDQSSGCVMGYKKILHNS